MEREALNCWKNVCAFLPFVSQIQGRGVSLKTMQRMEWPIWRIVIGKSTSQANEKEDKTVCHRLSHELSFD